MLSHDVWVDSGQITHMGGPLILAAYQERYESSVTDYSRGRAPVPAWDMSWVWLLTWAGPSPWLRHELSLSTHVGGPQSLTETWVESVYSRGRAPVDRAEVGGARQTRHVHVRPRAARDGGGQRRGVAHARGRGAAVVDVGAHQRRVVQSVLFVEDVGDQRALLVVLGSRLAAAAAAAAGSRLRLRVGVRAARRARRTLQALCACVQASQQPKAPYRAQHWNTHVTYSSHTQHTHTVTRLSFKKAGSGIARQGL